MDKSIGFYDAGTEWFYHGLTLGLVVLQDNQYKIKSNRESSDGAYATVAMYMFLKWPNFTI